MTTSAATLGLWSKVATDFGLTHWPNPGIGFGSGLGYPFFVRSSLPSIVRGRPCLEGGVVQLSCGWGEGGAHPRVHGVGGAW